LKQIIDTKEAPQAIGPYSQAVKSGRLLLISGQLPIDTETGQLIRNDITSATKKSLENMKAIIEEAGAKMTDIIKTTIFIKDMDNFAAMNEAYQNYFQFEAPARSCVEVCRLPRDADLEIEAIAYISD
jgi:2-iminobutanoate/2-iminopropanoate deaminase